MSPLTPLTPPHSEANKQKLAYSYGLAIPKIIDVVKIGNKQAIAMEYIQGDTPGKMLYKDSKNTRKYMQTSVDMQIQIHAILI